MSERKISVRRKAGDVSPKVSVPSTVLLVIAVVTSITSGDIDADQIALAVSSVITLALGYFVTDKREV